MSASRLRARSPRRRSVVAVLAVSVLLAACSSTPSGGASQGAGAGNASAPPASAGSQPSMEASMAPSAPASESASAGAGGSPAAGSQGPTAVPTAVDPCSLVTAAEASQLAGGKFGKGKEQKTDSNARSCTYGSNTLNVFMVYVAQAPDQATANAAKAAYKAEIEKAIPTGVKVTELPDLADGAVIFRGSAKVGGQTFSASSIAVLKGTVYFGISDVNVGGNAPSDAALKAQAQTSLGRIP